MAVLTILLAQMQTTTSVAYERLSRRIKERTCRRALDSVPGLASRILTEGAAGQRFDSLDEEWAKPKYFNIGDVRVEILITDCARRYDLKPLLEENPDKLERNKADFVAFADACGLDPFVGERLADAIAQEAEARRLEDTTLVEEEAEEGQGEDQEEQTVRSEEMVPLWLDDVLSLPGLAREDREAIRLAGAGYEDPVTLEWKVVRFLDEITMWRKDQVNINTAGPEVLRYTVPGLQEQELVVDEILRYRAEGAFKNVSQLGNVVGVSEDLANELARSVRLNSTRFRVTATARIQGSETGGLRRRPVMELIMERRPNGRCRVLWRHTNL